MSLASDGFLLRLVSAGGRKALHVTSPPASRQLECETVRSPQPVSWFTLPEIVVPISHVSRVQVTDVSSLPKALALCVCICKCCAHMSMFICVLLCMCM